jgi:hypothetical protein
MCLECGQDKPVTFRNKAAGVMSACAECITRNHPDLPRPPNPATVKAPVIPTIPDNTRNFVYTWSRTDEEGHGVSTLRFR